MKSRREFLAGSLSAGALGLPSSLLLPAHAAPGAPPVKPGPTPEENLTLRAYLGREATRITESALAEYRDAETFRRLLPERRRQYLEMMGLEHLPPPAQRPPLNVKVTGTVERPGYRIEKLYYESLPQLYVTANLYVPESDAKTPMPGVLYVCGHSDTQKVHYQAHPRRWAQLGFACLIVETVQLGEVRGYHHGCYREGWFHWYSRGYSSAAVELLNGIRGLDLLAARPDVDGKRLGVTGISGGGAVSWWIAAADERVQACAPVCGTATLASHVQDRTIDGHCDCMWWVNHYGWDLADVGALVAPRPLMIASADRDGIFTLASIRQVHRQLAGLYGKLGRPEQLRLVETPGGHSYHERSRTEIFSWFLKHLAGKEVPPERVGDLDEDPARLESADTLRVFVGGPRKEDRTLTIHEDFIRLPEAPVVKDRSSLGETRIRVVKELRAKTFHRFPGRPPALDVRVELESADNNRAGSRFTFRSEEGMRLAGHLSIPNSLRRPAPVLVALRSPGEERNATEGWSGRLSAPWARAVVEPRGTGETAWGEELQWHLRRSAAWTGRTIASMRVWDVLRGLEAVRSLPGVDGEQVSLAARGEMAAVALYAALLDGKVRTLFLQDPPATQNAPSRPDGRGPTIEMLSCLRITDLPQVAGLLYPTELVLVGQTPETYAWAKELYTRLGVPGKYQEVADLGAWRAERG